MVACIQTTSSDGISVNSARRPTTVFFNFFLRKKYLRVNTLRAELNILKMRGYKNFLRLIQTLRDQTASQISCRPDIRKFL